MRLTEWRLTTKKAAGFKPTAYKKKTMGFFFSVYPWFLNKLVVFYLAGPWIDFLKKKPSKNLKKPK